MAVQELEPGLPCPEGINKWTEKWGAQPEVLVFKGKAIRFPYTQEGECLRAGKKFGALRAACEVIWSDWGWVRWGAPVSSSGRSWRWSASWSHVRAPSPPALWAWATVSCASVFPLKYGGIKWFSAHRATGKVKLGNLFKALRACELSLGRQKLVLWPE